MNKSSTLEKSAIESLSGVIIAGLFPITVDA
jgi:hypothetical protein